jgi:hypothetical protein
MTFISFLWRTDVAHVVQELNTAETGRAAGASLGVFWMSGKIWRESGGRKRREKIRWDRLRSFP